MLLHTTTAATADPQLPEHVVSYAKASAPGTKNTTCLLICLSRVPNALSRCPHLAETRGVMKPATDWLEVQHRWHSCWRNTIWSTFLLVLHLRRILPINSRLAVRKAGALRLRSKWIFTLLNTFSSPLNCRAVGTQCLD